MSSARKINYSSFLGSSLLELCSVLAISSILVAVSYPSLSNIFRRHKLFQQAQHLQQLISHYKDISQIKSSNLLLEFEDKKIIVYSYPEEKQKRIVLLGFLKSSSANFSTVRHGANNLLLFRASGTASAGSVLLENAAGDYCKILVSLRQRVKRVCIEAGQRT